MVLFGGKRDRRLLSTIWEWDGDRWERFGGLVATAERKWYAMAYDPIGKVYLFGGHGRFLELGDLWTWNGVTWSEVLWDGKGPSARREAAMAYDKGGARASSTPGSTCCS